MKKEDLFDAITDVEDQYIEEAAAMKRARTLRLVKFLGNAAAVLVIVAIVINRGFFNGNITKEAATESSIAFTAAGNTLESEEAAMAFEEVKLEESKKTISQDTLNDLVAGYDENLLLASPIPEMAKRPDESARFSTESADGESFDSQMEAWSKDIDHYTEVTPVADLEADSFSGKLIKNVFKDNKDDNKIVSPINVYFALAMLAETTDGNARTELLNALGVNNIQGLRNNSLALWNYNFRDDGVATSILGSSIWLDNKYNYNMETLSQLVDSYHSASFAGEMGSDSLNRSLRNWMNEQTGGFLEEQISGLSLTKEMIAALVTTIYFKDSWIDSFDEISNTQMTFKGTKGDKDVTFMHKSKTGTVYFGEGYRATDLPMNEGYTMTFIKADESTTANELLQSDDVIRFILSTDAAEGSYRPIVELSLPKFDAQSQTELTEVLKAMGVNDVFTGAADFSPLTTDTDDIAVSSVLHGARVKIDEEGCEAAAYTMIMMGTTAFRQDEIEQFVLDKPFIYVIRNNMGAPLFVGVINNIE